MWEFDDYGNATNTETGDEIYTKKFLAYSIIMRTL